MTSEKSHSDIMSSSEAAKYLKMHTKTICRLAKEGKIPANRISSEWYFLRSTLDRWIANALI